MGTQRETAHCRTGPGRYRVLVYGLSKYVHSGRGTIDRGRVLPAYHRGHAAAEGLCDTGARSLPAWLASRGRSLMGVAPFLESLRAFAQDAQEHTSCSRDEVVVAHVPELFNLTDEDAEIIGGGWIVVFSMNFGGHAGMATLRFCI